MACLSALALGRCHDRNGVGLPVSLAFVLVELLAQALDFLFERRNAAVALSATRTSGTVSRHGNPVQYQEWMSGKLRGVRSEVHPHCSGRDKGSRAEKATYHETLTGYSQRPNRGPR